MADQAVKDMSEYWMDVNEEREQREGSREVSCRARKEVYYSGGEKNSLSSHKIISRKRQR